MKSISLVASEPHYRDHIQPIFDLIPERHQHQRGIPDYMLVGGYADVKAFPLRKYVYVEHGAGQSYTEPTDPKIYRSVQSFYSGGRGHQNCALFLCPNEEVAARWQARYKNTPVEVIGCPRLDPWHAGLRGSPEDKTLAITFHWDALFTGIPETASAFSYYQPALVNAIRNFTRQGWTVLGHSHPRYPAVRKFWELPEMTELGVQYVSADEVLDRASVLIADNTSMQAEFLSLGRRVVWLNLPTYRRDVVHGGRFWTWPDTMGGTQVNSPDDLVRLDMDSVAPTIGQPYALPDGGASERAASKISSILLQI